MKLIDIEKVKSEIERKLNSYHPTEITSGRYALTSLLDFLDTLSEEKPNSNLEKVKAEIEKRMKHNSARAEIDRSSSKAGAAAEDKEILSFLDTLPEEKQEDLEEEIEKNIYNPYFDLDGVAVKGATSYLKVEDVANIARHFYNLGLNSKQDDCPKIKGWVARDYNTDDLFLYKYKPIREDNHSDWSAPCEGWLQLPKDYFHDVTRNTEPIEVELILRKI